MVAAELRARSAKLDAIRAQIAELKRQSAIVVAQRQQAERQAAIAEARVGQLVAAEKTQVAAIQGKIDGGEETARRA